MNNYLSHLFQVQRFKWTIVMAYDIFLLKYDFHERWMRCDENGNFRLLLI